MKITDFLEPRITGCLRGQDEENLDPEHFIGLMLASIAISQKRQADSMDRLEAASRPSYLVESDGTTTRITPT